MRIPPQVQSTPWAVPSNDEGTDDVYAYDDDDTRNDVFSDPTYSSATSHYLRVMLIVACIAMTIAIIGFSIVQIDAALRHNAIDGKVVAAKPAIVPKANIKEGEPKNDPPNPKLPPVANKKKDEPKWIAKALDVKYAYFKNVAAADLKYANRPILVEGEVLRIKADPQTRGAYFVEVENGSTLGFYDIVSCHFAEQQAFAVAKLERRARVRIVGNLSSNRVTPHPDLGMRAAKVELSIVNSDLLSMKPPIPEN